MDMHQVSSGMGVMSNLLESHSRTPSRKSYQLGRRPTGSDREGILGLGQPVFAPFQMAC